MRISERWKFEKRIMRTLEVAHDAKGRGELKEGMGHGTAAAGGSAALHCFRGRWL